MQQVQTAAELEVRWTQWQAKNCRLDAKRVARRARAVKVVVMALLAVVLIFRAEASIYEDAVRTVIAVGAFLAAKRAVEVRQLPWAGIFAFVLAVWNPFVPAFGVTGPLGLAVVLATIAIFAVAAAQTQPVAAVSRAGAL